MRYDHITCHVCGLKKPGLWTWQIRSLSHPVNCNNKRSLTVRWLAADAMMIRYVLRAVVFTVGLVSHSDDLYPISFILWSDLELMRWLPFGLAGICTLQTAESLSKTRMLAIKVTTDSRPPRAVPIAATTNPERATNRRRGWLKSKPSFIRKPHVVISRQSPFAANVILKLVAMATSLSPSICLHRIACPRKPTPRIKEPVASCHTAEVISIQSLPSPPHTPREQPISELGGDSLPPYLVRTSSPSHRLTLLV